MSTTQTDISRIIQPCNVILDNEHLDITDKRCLSNKHLFTVKKRQIRKIY